MSSCRERLAALVVAAAAGVAMTGAAQARDSAYPQIGRAATPKEVAAWDIDVRPDFKGLPKGSGSVEDGMQVWENRCASCHGIFGESNQFFSPLVGGTTAEDVRTGRVARLTDPGFPGRTTLMKVPTISTLWDYINRAMPWNEPKSLKPDEVYAVTAYLLNLGGIVPENFTLSDRNIADVQQRMPNRNGMTTAHAMWPGAAFGNRKPDVQGSSCMRNCTGVNLTVASELPDFARDAHGNLAEQNRPVGAQRGADTMRPAPASLSEARAHQQALTQAGAQPQTAAAAGNDPAPATALLAKYSCNACHGITNAIVGPSMRDVAGKYSGRADAHAYLAGKIRTGGSGVWGQVPMPAQSLSEAEAAAIAKWLVEGAKQ